jgi:hypothetical protein
MSGHPWPCCSSAPSPRAAPAGRILLLAVGSSLIIGCGGPPTATVSGRVTVGGQLVTAGQIAFESDGTLLASAIGPDGRYQLRNGGTTSVPPGDYTVLLAPPPPELVEDPETTEIKAATAVDQSRYPKKYRSPETSDLRQTIPPGNSEIDLEFPAG